MYETVLKQSIWSNEDGVDDRCERNGAGTSGIGHSFEKQPVDLNCICWSWRHCLRLETVGRGS